MLLGQGMRLHHMLVRTVMVMVMVKVDGVLWHSCRVMVMVKVDGELWHSRRVYVLVWEVMLHHVFFVFSDPKIGGGVPTPHPKPPR